MAARAAILKRGVLTCTVSLRMGEHAVRFGHFTRAPAVLAENYCRIWASTPWSAHERYVKRARRPPTLSCADLTVSVMENPS